MEILVTKADASAAQKLKEEPLCVVSDMTGLMSGHTISFLEFSQGMCQSRTMLREIYEPVFSSQVISKYDQLKEIASEAAPPNLFSAQTTKRKTTKKKK